VAVCPSCGSANPEANAFCGQCGAALAVATCPSCYAPNTPSQRFCGKCGAALEGVVATATTSAGQQLDERKLATVLFADVVGFTSLAERTDPEIVAHMVDTAFRELGEAVAAHGGTVDKFMGDSVMAVFGVPTAHDDDAERAVAAALAMRDLGGDLAFSIGVNSGEVMATAVGRAADMTVIGDTVNVAARLEKAAGPGEVLCGRLTVELARGRVRFREHQPVLLKGKREPVEVWVAESLRPTDTEWSATGPRLVGRDDELGFLEAQWRRALKERQTRVLLLTGEAGSGKTRLQSELASVAATAGDATIIRATYPAYGVMGGARLAKEIARQLGPAMDAAVNARVRSVAGELDPSLDLIDPEGMQQEQLWAFVRLLQEKAKEGPLLLALDDMHNSDDRTLEIINDVASRLSEVSVLMLLSGRAEPGDWLARFPDATSVRLGPLPRADAVLLAAELVGEMPLSSEAAEFLAERASGNPLYLRELVAMAQTRGLFVEANGCYRLAAYEAIPATLQAVLAARLDALEPRQKLGLQHVAVLGESATAERVTRLGTPEAPAVLRSLVDSGMLRHGSDGSYETADSLLREVAYETLPRNLRGDLHRRAATTAANGEERARHLDRAAEYLSADGDLALQAAEALADEGEQLYKLSRHRDAMRVLERAVTLGCRRPSALLALAKMQALTGQHPHALGVLALIEDDPKDPEVAMERDHTAANLEAFDNPSWAAPRLEEVARRWHAAGNTSKEAWAYSNAGVSYFNMSRLPEAVAALEHALELFEAIEDEPGALATTSFLCLVKPTDERVPTWLARALESADAAGDRARQLNTLSTLTWNHFFRSFCGGAAEVAAAEGFALRWVALAEELDALDLAVHGWSLLVVMARLSGRLDVTAERAAELQRVLGSVQPGEAWLGWAASYCAAVASGVAGATPPFPPSSSTEPIVAMARLIIEIELILAGRPTEALEHVERPNRPDLGVMSDLLGVFRALALILAGREAEAEPLIDRAYEASSLLKANGATKAAAALRAEIRREPSLLPPLPQPISPNTLSIADVLVLRAHVACGDSVSENSYRAALTAIAAPGLESVAAHAGAAD
jgi:class 3 adenylate cyclase/tetratricopeptide (TPR) repeat protein